MATLLDLDLSGGYRQKLLYMCIRSQLSAFHLRISLCSKLLKIINFKNLLPLYGGYALDATDEQLPLLYIP